MTHHMEMFPFDEIRDTGDENGNYFNTVDEALVMVKTLGLPNGQKHVWSVVEGEEAEDVDYDDPDYECNTPFVYGPSRHYVNLVGYVVTRESHDEETYYED